MAQERKISISYQKAAVIALQGLIGVLTVLLWAATEASVAAKCCASLGLLAAFFWAALAFSAKTWAFGKIQITADGLFLLLCFFIYLGAVFVIPRGTAPDEPMRYQVTQFIRLNGTLPRGDDPQMIDPQWGTSYAFFPYLSNLVGVLFQKIYLLAFPASKALPLLFAARMAGVLFAMLAAVYFLKIADKLFCGSYKWLYAVLTALLPQWVYIAGYANNDGIGTLSGAIVLYAWLLGEEKKWDTKSLLLLAAGLSVCALSYYNAYGYILCSILLVSAHWIKEKPGWGIAAKRAGMVAGVCLALAGWWFARQMILYDGDLFGIASSNACAEANAIAALKPSARVAMLDGAASLADLGASLLLWLKMSWRSFFAVYGMFSVYVPYGFYHVWTAFSLGASCAAFLRDKEKTAIFSRKSVFLKGAVAASAGFPLLLSLYNSAFSDFQPQGRYWMPGLTAIMLLGVWGIQKAARRVKIKEAAVTLLTILMTGLFLFGAVYYLYKAY